MFVIILVLVTLIKGIYNANYDRYQVFEIIPENIRHQHVLDKLHASTKLDFWSASKILNHPNIVMVHPNLNNYFRNILDANDMKYRKIINNVANVIENTTLCRTCKDLSKTFFVNKYNDYNAIISYLTSLKTKYPNKIELINLERTYENRKVLGIKIGCKKNKPAVLIDAGFHAREWIAPATALNFIKKILENTNMTNDLNWYIFPLMNPDGYVYSQEKDRLWRKNRSKNVKCCRGVDLNRNFAYHWMENGASMNECSEIYAGEFPFSEPESRGLKKFVLQHMGSIKLYLSLHSYGNLILYPWSYTYKSAENSFELENLANMAAKAMERVSSNTYTVGSSREVLYESSGTSKDWMMGVAKIRLVYTIELPGGGEYGFDLPESEIEDVAKEVFESIKVFEQYVKQNV